MRMQRQEYPTSGQPSGCCAQYVLWVGPKRYYNVVWYPNSFSPGADDASLVRKCTVVLLDSSQGWQCWWGAASGGVGCGGVVFYSRL